jgi:enediyne polyketide synthase
MNLILSVSLETSFLHNKDWWYFMSKIAIVGMACRYPDAHTPQELWENVLSQRQAFRRYPPERLRLEDYWNQDRNAPDATYATQGAFIENYEFDRIRFRISGSAYRSSDLAHWLALDIATQALADAGFTTHGDLPSESTGVIVGNTLTGEFSRANSLRLRWPYVRRVVDAVLEQEGRSIEQKQDFLRQLEGLYKEPFTPIGEETLAGGLSNTIAGRICNYFNLKGGGYTIDGACSSSLLATATACSMLAAGDIDLALVGGVDLSLDPFELIGFAKTAALAAEEMYVYDRHSNGFIPGEGCGFIVLMRYEDAQAQRRRIYALIQGWGISSDGSGGITRPEVEGQLLALTRAYRRAGTGIDTVAYFEGHGTGTNFGDAIELQTLSRARREAHTQTSPASIGSIKANIGHTKAAAGVAGTIKAAMALFTQVIPPTTGTRDPHPELTVQDAALKVQETGTIWPARLPLRAGVSAMGFGGINAHLVLEGPAKKRRSTLTTYERTLLSSPQDAELFLLQGQDTLEVQHAVTHLLTLAPHLSKAELTDLAMSLMHEHKDGTVRAALVASSAGELTKLLERLHTLLVHDTQISIDAKAGLFLSHETKQPHIGFLFPGQGAPSYVRGGLLRRRFKIVDDLYTQVHLPLAGDCRDTRIAQPAIVMASLAALRVLKRLGIHADLGIGHSLGELSALYWAGAFDEETLLNLAIIRGDAMSTLGSSTGAMASIEAPQEVVERLIQDEEVVIAGMNAPQQTVISGEQAAIASVINRAQTRNLRTVPLHVSHAFHSPLVAAAIEPFAAYLADKQFQPLQRTIVSTVTGARLAPQEDLKDLLCRQITSPVRFLDAIKQVWPDIDLWIEVGPGQILSGLAEQCAPIPAIALDAGGSSIKGLLHAAGAAFALGAPLNYSFLCTDRFSRPFNLERLPRFFVNPCERAPLPNTEIPFIQQDEIADSAEEASLPTVTDKQVTTNSAIELVRNLVAERAELPISAVNDAYRMLSDLHLNSITVGQIVSEAARTLHLLPPVSPTDYADASVREIAQALEELSQTTGTAELQEHKQVPAGVDGWVRPFQVEYIEKHISNNNNYPQTDSAGTWQVLAEPDDSLAATLKEACEHIGGSGILLCLPAQPDEQQLPFLLQGIQETLKSENSTHFVLIQHGSGVASMARTLYLEAPQKTVCVIDIPPGHPQTLEWVLAEIQAARGYSEAVYDEHGKRHVPTLQPVTLTKETYGSLPLGPDDVLLVTGGGKGIAAECALSLAQETGVRLALLGRSKPDDDSELESNLSRFEAAHITFHYVSADVTDIQAVQQAICVVEAKLGPITAILHGAGANVPRLLKTMTPADLTHTLAPKVRGLQHVLAAIDPGKLRLLITFGSIIARSGMRGEADYALANDWLAMLTEQFHTLHPACRCLCLEWSVWSGVGMGERLGRVEALMREGITPISPDQGITLFSRLLKHKLPTVRVVVSSRLGEVPTLQLACPDLPFLRFLEQPRVYYPGIELITDVDLATTTDLYLEDHKFRGERLLPAVVGLEAMAQAVMALTGRDDLPTFVDVQLDRPVVVPQKSMLKIRIAALARESGNIDVALRSEETAFQVDHFRATCHFTDCAQTSSELCTQLPAPPTAEQHRLQLDPAPDLYGKLLFHQGRFQRLLGYYRLQATECIAEITPYRGEDLFIHYMPSTLMLGDFTARDAVIHCIQACIPHARLLPISIEKLIFESDSPHLAHNRFVYARERARHGDVFIYDVEVRTADGNVLERWSGLHLQRVEAIQPQKVWREALLGPYIERMINDFLPQASLRLTLRQYINLERQERSDQALSGLLSPAQAIHRRPDGKPGVMERPALAVSATHHAQLTLTAVGHETVACDVEAITGRSKRTWQDLLGQERYLLASVIATQAEEGLDAAATRVWSASECLKKAGVLINTPLLLDKLKADGWVILKAGNFAITTYITSIQGIDEQLVFAIGSSA